MLSIIKNIRVFIYTTLIVLLTMLSYFHIKTIYNNNFNLEESVRSCELQKDICTKNDSLIYNYKYNCDYNCSKRVTSDITKSNKELNILSLVIITFSLIFVVLIYLSENKNQKTTKSNSKKSSKNRNDKKLNAKRALKSKKLKK